MKKLLAISICLVLLFCCCSCDLFDKNQTILQRARELASNVLKLPSFFGSDDKVVSKASVASNRKLASRGSSQSNENITDITTPDEDYYNNDAWEPEISIANSFRYDPVDTQIFYYKEIVTERFMGKISQLDTWIGTDSYLRRMSYDVNSDVVTMEFAEKSISIEGCECISYHKIYSTYNTNGKMVIVASFCDYVGIGNSILNSTTTGAMRYVEDELYYFSSQDPGYFDPDADVKSFTEFVIEKDLKGSNNMTIFRRFNAYWEYSTNYYEYLDGGVFWQDENYLYKYNGRDLCIYTLNGKFIADVGGSANLYYFDGWDSCYVEGLLTDTDQAVPANLVIGDVTYVTQDRYFIYAWPGVLGDGSRTHYPWINISLDWSSDSLLNVAYQFEQALESFGLSLKDDSLSDICSNAMKYVNSIEAFGSSQPLTMTAEDIRVCHEENMLFGEMSKEEMLAILEEPAIGFEDQIIDETLLQFMKINLSGTVGCIDDELDLSAIQVSLKQNALLVKNEEYSLNIVLRSNFDSYSCKVDAQVFNGKGLTFFIPSDFAIDYGQLAENEYSIYMYVANKSGRRVTELIELTAGENFSITKADIKYKYQIISESGKLKIIVENILAI